MKTESWTVLTRTQKVFRFSDIYEAEFACFTTFGMLKINYICF